MWLATEQVVFQIIGTKRKTTLLSTVKERIQYYINIKDTIEMLVNHNTYSSHKKSFFFGSTCSQKNQTGSNWLIAEKELSK